MSRTGSSATTRRGAYGLRITGLDGAEHLLVRAEPSWPRLDVVVEEGSMSDEAGAVDDDRAVIPLHDGGVLVVERDPGRAIFRLPAVPEGGALAHPYLSPAAAVMARWHGRETFHAGAFDLGAGAWGLLAGREGGKSSTLGRLGLDGVSTLCDDVLVVEEDTAFAGPRAIDLRKSTATRLGVGDPLGVVGVRERWRMPLDDVESSMPLRGWVFLAWGDDLSLEPVPAGERLRRLASQRAVSLEPRDPGVLLRLAALPGFELRRPRRLTSLDPAVELLVTSLSRER